MVAMVSLPALSGHPRWSLVQDGKALSHFLVARKNKKKHERSRIMSGKYTLLRGLCLRTSFHFNIITKVYSLCWCVIVCCTLSGVLFNIIIIIIIIPKVAGYGVGVGNCVVV